jgi:hypothetical protein
MLYELRCWAAGFDQMRGYLFSLARENTKLAGTVARRVESYLIRNFVYPDEKADLQ